MVNVTTAPVDIVKKMVRSRWARQRMRKHPSAAGRAVSITRRLRRESDETQHGRSARYCYGVWLRHLDRLQACGLTLPPASVVEVGPGDTIGVGVAALLSGSDRLFALDSHRYLSVPATLAILPELTELFAQRVAIPDDTELPDVKPHLSSYSFPHSMLKTDLLSQSLSPSRVAAIRRAVLELKGVGCGVDVETRALVAADTVEGENPSISYTVEWRTDAIVPGSVDLIVSQAVMEHVVDIEAAYRSFARWLVPGGRISHQIDFRCHGTSFDWNGHWTYDQRSWKIVANAKAFRWINRQPVSAHLAAVEAAGFDVQLVQSVANVDGAPKSCFAAPFADMSESDASCQGALVVAQRRF